MLTLLLIALLQPVPVQLASLVASGELTHDAAQVGRASIALPAERSRSVVADDPARVAVAALGALEARMPGSRANFEVTVVRLVDTADPMPEIRVVLPATPLLPKGKLQVRLERVADAAPAGWAMLELARFDSVAVLSYSLTRGEAVHPGDLRFAWVETTRFSGDPMTPELVRRHDQLVASRSLSAERLLRIDDLRPPAAAETGDRIRMLFARNGFRMEIACDARDRGDVGDIIRLYADESDRMYRARLTGPGTATWIETL